MKNYNPLAIVLNLVFGVILCASISAQCVDRPGDPCVSLNQSTIDAATKAATELLQARDVIARFAVERSTTAAEREAAGRLIDRLNGVIAVQDRLNVEYNAVIALYKQAITMQADIIDRLSKQINAPKSAWQRLAGVLKQVANVALGIVIGRGSL